MASAKRTGIKACDYKLSHMIKVRNRAINLGLPNLIYVDLHNKNETLVLGSSIPVLGVKLRRG